MGFFSHIAVTDNMIVSFVQGPQSADSVTLTPLLLAFIVQPWNCLTKCRISSANHTLASVINMLSVLPIKLEERG